MPAPSQDMFIAAVSWPNLKWADSTITFSIPKAGAAWPGYGGTNPKEPFSPGYGVLNETQSANFRLAIEQFDRVIAPRLVETDDATNPGDIRVAFSDTSSFHAYFPDQTIVLNDDAFAGDVWLDGGDKSESFSPTMQPGDLISSGFLILMRNLGTAMGLRYTNDGSNLLPVEYNSTRYTVMSGNTAIDQIHYEFTPSGNRTIEIVHPRSLQVGDILALQAKYGADPDTNAGATRYTWNQSEAFFETIYDAGGIDTLDLSAHTRGSIVDLTPGAYSSIAYFSAAQQAAYWKTQTPNAVGVDRSFEDPSFASYGYTWKDNLGIAYSTVIENFVGGSGADTVSANAANNALAGNGGDDQLLGGDGHDSLSGGAGQDFLRGGEGADTLSGGDAYDDMHGNTGDDVLFGGAGGDWVVGGQGADRLEGEDGDDIVYGNLGQDWCDGGPGNDAVRGGQDNDVLFGQAGDDWMSGDRGDDTLSGGAGADTFYSFAEAGLDRIVDFNRLEGDRIRLDPGAAYVVTQSGADVMIDLGSGGRIVLANVSLTSLTGDWIA